MQKIMFNDRYGLTQAAIEGRKTMTRRLEFDDELQQLVTDSDSYYYDDGYLVFATQGVDIHHVKTRYKIGEVVAVAQSYEQAGIQSWAYLSRPEIDGYQIISTHKGWRNKMYVSAELMPHQIRITGIRCERLQDISNEDCMKEGICGGGIGFFVPGIKCEDWGKEAHVDTEDGMTWKLFPTPRAAFAVLIDKVSGRGTWASNLWVVVYEFELVK